MLLPPAQDWLPVSKQAKDVAAVDSLCVGCGLCCDGTLFSRVIATAEEQDELRPLGFTFDTHSDGICFAQPCRASVGGLCTIYPSRPSNCRKYRCALLERVEDSEITAKEARATIEEAFRLIKNVEDRYPGARNREQRILLRASLAADLDKLSLSERIPLAEGLLALVALDAHLDTKFRKQGEAES
jgi:Fe-S-cluster containining protein